MVPCAMLHFSRFAINTVSKSNPISSVYNHVEYHVGMHLPLYYNLLELLLHEQLASCDLVAHDTFVECAPQVSIHLEGIPKDGISIRLHKNPTPLNGDCTAVGGIVCGSRKVRQCGLYVGKGYRRRP